MNEFPLHQLANIDVQYEDNHVIVAVKPPNMLSQADKTGDTDILSQLKEYIKIKYITQLPTQTPQFAFFVNLPQYIKEPYRRFLENKLREQWDFSGVPVAIHFRQK